MGGALKMPRGLRRVEELRAIAEGADRRFAALFALGAGSSWAREYQRADLRAVLLSQYEASLVQRVDLPRQRDLLRAFLVELGPTLDPDLREFTEEVLRLVEAACTEEPCPATS